MVPEYPSKLNPSAATVPEAETFMVSPPSFMLPVPKTAFSDWKSVRARNRILSLSWKVQLPATLATGDMIEEITGDVAGFVAGEMAGSGDDAAFPGLNSWYLLSDTQVPRRFS